MEALNCGIRTSSPEFPYPISTYGKKLLRSLANALHAHGIDDLREVEIRLAQRTATHLETVRL